MANALYRTIRDLPIIQLLKAMGTISLPSLPLQTKLQALWEAFHSLAHSVAILLTSIQMQAGYYAMKVSQLSRLADRRQRLKRAKRGKQALAYRPKLALAPASTN